MPLRCLKASMWHGINKRLWSILSEVSLAVFTGPRLPFLRSEPVPVKVCLLVVVNHRVTAASVDQKVSARCVMSKPSRWIASMGLYRLAFPAH